MEKFRRTHRGLDQQERVGYFEKLGLLDGEDPYELAPSFWSDDCTTLPSVSYPDVVSYLIFCRAQTHVGTLKVSKV